MEKLFVFIFLIFALPKSQAQDYLISFAGTGDTNRVGRVSIENLTRGTLVSLDEGQVLHLKSVLGVETRDINKTWIDICPNPSNGEAFLTFAAPENGPVMLQLTGFDGNTIFQACKTILKGMQCFRISGISYGIYLLTVTGKNFRISKKLMSTGMRVGTPEIDYVSYEKYAAPLPLKSNPSTIEMQYAEGDILLYKGISGHLSSIVTDVPTGSKTIVFHFLSCIDYDGNAYSTVKIGDQTWMAENLKTTHFSDGADIPLVESDLIWNNLSYTDKAYCFYDNSAGYASVYGALYTWPAAMNGAESSEANPSLVQGACPCGWHLPADAEWMELEMFLGMTFEEAYGLGWRGTNEGNQLKASHGWFDDGNGTNRSGFSALPGGSRMHDLFSSLGQSTCY